jgi:hypothetical protein
MDDPFIPGISSPPSLPLERFLPPLPLSMLTSWIKPLLPKGSWVLDPVGNHPFHPIELASAGFRVLVTANNPIHVFLLEVLASNPSPQEFEDALNILSRVAIGEDEQVEPYINSFYQVRCIHCGKPLVVSRFLWRRDEDNPYAYIGNCLACGLNGEQALGAEAAQSLRQLPTFSLHLARAIESIASINDPLRSDVESAINCYLKRPLALLQILTRKIANLELEERQKKLLQALILSSYDQLNTLWAHPIARTRPRQLVTPAVFQEVNLWQAMTAAIQQWQSEYQSVSVRFWPDVPPLSGGISIFKGRLRELSPEPPAGMIQAISAILPRPNQAFWTLSTLWTGWLWGKDVVLPLKNVIARQRYDWNWHANALHIMFQGLHRLVKEGTPLFMLILENEHEFLAAAHYAADAVGFKLQSLSMSGDGDIAQSLWTNALPFTGKIEPSERQSKARDAITEYLSKRGEPATYQHLHASILKKLHLHQLLAQYPEGNNDISISELSKSINPVFMGTDLLVRFGGGPASLDTGLYWLKEDPPYHPSVIDVVEATVVNYLQENAQAEYKDIRAAVNQNCAGLFTPEDEVISACLNAYADPLSEHPNTWKIRESECPSIREHDIDEIREILEALSTSLRYTFLDEKDTIKWLDEGSEVAYIFHLTTDAIISKYFFDAKETSPNNVILLPGSRANLLAYKLKRDPRLQAALNERWLCVKFRQIRTIKENPLLTRELFEVQMCEDPPEYQASQLALF